MDNKNITVTMPISEYEYMSKRLKELERIAKKSVYINYIRSSDKQKDTVEAEIIVRPEAITEMADFVYGYDDGLCGADATFKMEKGISNWVVKDFGCSEPIYVFE